MQKRVRVLIVDDSKTARELIKRSLLKYPDLDVIGEAANPIEARDIIVQDQPDVITLDVEMPGMNGLQFLEKIMRLRPIPVVMVSSLTAQGANVAIKALQMGAFECFPKKTSGGAGEAFAGLGRILLEAASSHPGHRSGDVKTRKPAGDRPHAHVTGVWKTLFDVVAIGSSTGGVEAVEEVLKGFPAGSPPVVICQHMPALFTASFASRLDSLIPHLSIAEVHDREVLAPGMVRIAPGGERHVTVEGGLQSVTTRLVAAPPVGGHCPSVDVLFSSVARHVGRNALGIILTGMGRDGAQGLLEMREHGAQTIAQDRASSVVYGMPRVATEIGAAGRTVPLKEIARVAMHL